MKSAGVSVIVPSFQGWPLLCRTLEAILFECRAAGGEWEVIVVDNESGRSTVDQLHELAGRIDELRVIARTGLQGRHFQPGAARNVGIEAARFPCLIFLDADCIPSTGLVDAYRSQVTRSPDTVFIGHRVFNDCSGVDPVHIAQDRGLLARLPPILSASNPGQLTDRRLVELRELDHHPRPYDCLFGCNFAVHCDYLADHRFSSAFDGHWGYEDVELGHRLHRAGNRFEYLREAFVFHQAGGALSQGDRLAGRRRNFAVADDLIPGFLQYRQASRRWRAAPDGTPCASRS
jgi:glycosyltransferase involved in cell wall biosynthesis